jgi:CPA2 family monovalent cation:H+ antiporter-2
MADPSDVAQFREALVILGAASVVIPVFLRLKLSPVIGFIAVGVVVGPYGLGALTGLAPWLSWVTITDDEAIRQLADFGIVLLLFMIGLELSFERLKALRRLVFGLGPVQVIGSAAVIGAACLAGGLPIQSAAVIGLALAMSSTAVVIQVLSEEKRLASHTGRTSLGVLLFQDVAVVPILFAIGLLAVGERALSGGAFATVMVQAATAIAVVLAVGRILVRPLFRSVARTGSPELFMAACLLLILGAGVATVAAGLSMTMGALLAGILLAETEYRRQIEVLVEPFKGLLVGVFLITIGIGIDVSLLASMPVTILAACIGLIAVKALIVGLVAPVFGVSSVAARQSGLLLAPGSEFTFVLMAAALTAGLVDERPANAAQLVAALTMPLIPLLSTLGARLAARRQAHSEPQPEPPAEGLDAGLVIIAGYGRVGEVVASLLEQQGVPYLAIDRDPDAVGRARKLGKPVYYGDLARQDFLERCGLPTARALVVTMDSAAMSEDVVAAARAVRGDLIIVARARDARHAGRLYARGATDAVPETTEASLLLGEAVLLDIGMPAGPVIAAIHDKREAFRLEIQAAARSGTARPPLPVRQRTRARLRIGGRRAD